jgi:hypothetical protein
MTLSSASRSSLDVDEVAAIAAGATGFWAGALARWRREGDGAAATGGNACETGAACPLVAEVPCVGAVVAVNLRAIGRGFGSGILDFSGVCAACAMHPSARTSAKLRLVARIAGKVAGRKRGAGMNVGTDVLCGESLTLQT